MSTLYSSIVSKFWGGDPVVPNGPVGSAPLWRKLYDSLRALRDGTLGRLEWSGDFAVSGSAANNFTVEIGAISCAWVYDGTNYVPLAYAGGTINQSSVFGGGGTLTAAVDWWHVYLYSNAGTAAFEISTTAPLDNRVFKTGDNTRRYLGCFRTNTSGVPISVRASRGRYVYTIQQAVLATADGTATGAAANVIVRPSGTTEEPLIPAHARIATLDARLNHGTGAVNVTASIYANGDTSGASVNILADDIVTGVTWVARATQDVELDTSYRFAYLLSTSTGTPGLAVYCRGWVE